jgi:hypothetical protein
MDILFIHQNFPAQFGHIASYLVKHKGYRCTFASEQPAGVAVAARRTKPTISASASRTPSGTRMSLHVVACRCMSLHVVACRCMSLHVVACRCMSLHVVASLQVVASLHVVAVRRSRGVCNDATMQCARRNVVPQELRSELTGSPHEMAPCLWGFFMWVVFHDAKFCFTSVYAIHPR